MLSEQCLNGAVGVVWNASEFVDFRKNSGSPLYRRGVYLVA